MELDGLVYNAEAFRYEMEEYVDEMGSHRGLSLSTQEDVREYVEGYGASSISMWFTDMLGFLGSFCMTQKETTAALDAELESDSC